MIGFKHEESQIELHKLFWRIWEENCYQLPHRTDLFEYFPKSLFLGHWLTLLLQIDPKMLSLSACRQCGV